LVKPTNKIHKSLKKWLIACFFLYSTFAFLGQTAKLDLTINKIDLSRGGEIRVGLFDSKETFKEKADPAYEAVLPVNDSILYCTFSPPEGIYAAAIYHDENEDNTLNTRIFGIPVEGVGFSGEFESKVKPPDFEQASISITSDTSIVVNIVYAKRDD